MSFTGSSHASPDESRRADVELRLPADSAYVSVLRTTTASLAARLDFTIDDIEDLRIAVGEACALVLPEADAASPLRAEFFLSARRLTIRVSVTGPELGAPDHESFAWQVLDTLTSSVSAQLGADTLAIVLTLQTDAPERAL